MQDAHKYGVKVELGDRFDRALLLAHRLHRSDLRKQTTIPYVSHLMGVCSLVLERGGDEDQAIGALLHDSIEDHWDQISPEDIQRDFGERVRTIVVVQKPPSQWEMKLEPRRIQTSLGALPVMGLISGVITPRMGTSAIVVQAPACRRCT